MCALKYSWIFHRKAVLHENSSGKRFTRVGSLSRGIPPLRVPEVACPVLVLACRQSEERVEDGDKPVSVDI